MWPLQLPQKGEVLQKGMCEVLSAMGFHKTTCNRFCSMSHLFPRFCVFNLRLSITCGAAFGIQPKREMDPNLGQSKISMDSCRLVDCVLHSIFLQCKLPFIFHEFCSFSFEWRSTKRPRRTRAKNTGSARSTGISRGLHLHQPGLLQVLQVILLP